MQPSDEIKSRLDIVDVLKEYIHLKPVGSNFSAHSPFNNEKTPSFMVSPEKQIWHCFSSGKGGDVITFIMEMEGVSFVEALRILAPKAGVTLQKQNPEEASKRNKLLDLMEIAANYYHRVLMESSLAESARKYLTERGLKEDTLLDWKIGFSPDSWTDLVDLLRQKGYKDQDMITAGLANQKQETGRVYNRFRDRIMFPINDYNGNIVAFSARVRPDKEEGEIMGKYINSPQTPIYDKSKILFGLDKAKTEIRSKDASVIVEGQMDVITAHQEGFRNVVASSGTALTPDQLRLIKRYSNNLIFAFDMDQAGQMAVDRAVREAMPMDINIKIVNITEGKDPDEIIKKSPEKWREFVDSARHIMEHYFDKVFSEVDVSGVEGKREAAKKLLPVINRIASSIEKDHWLQKISEELGVNESSLRETLKEFNNKENRYNRSRSEPENKDGEKEKKPSSREELVSQNLLALLLRFPAHINYVVDRVGLEDIKGGDNKVIYNKLILYYNNHNLEEEAQNDTSGINYASFKSFLKNRIDPDSSEYDNPELASAIKLLDKLVVLGEKDYYDTDDKQAKNEVIKSVSILKRASVRDRMRDVEKAIVDAEKEGKSEEVKSLMSELKILSDELRELEKQV